MVRSRCEVIHNMMLRCWNWEGRETVLMPQKLGWRSQNTFSRHCARHIHLHFTFHSSLPIAESKKRSSPQQPVSIAVAGAVDGLETWNTGRAGGREGKGSKRKMGFSMPLFHLSIYPSIHSLCNHPRPLHNIWTSWPSSSLLFTVNC